MSTARANQLKTTIWHTLYGFEPTKAQLEGFELTGLEDSVAYNGSSKNVRERATEAYINRDAECFAAQAAVDTKNRELREAEKALHEAKKAKERAWIVCEFVLGRK